MTTSRIYDYKFIDVILNLKKHNVKKKQDISEKVENFLITPIGNTLKHKENLFNFTLESLPAVGRTEDGHNVQVERQVVVPPFGGTLRAGKGFCKQGWLYASDGR